jgi:hypothetical protein
MSAVAVRALPPAATKPKTLLLELSNADLTLDPFQDRLISQGYEVITAKSYDAALKLARSESPSIIIVYDDPVTGIDAVQWLNLQHYDRISRLAMTPLLILADISRLSALKVQELPDRVVVLQRRADTLNQLTRAVKRLLYVWDVE